MVAQTLTCYRVCIGQQVGDASMWRGVQDGVPPTEPDVGPSPQPLAQRLSGSLELAKDKPAAVSVVSDRSSDDDRAVESITPEEAEGQDGAENLRIDAHADGDVADLEFDNGTPPRGPPKTPKRNKASSPHDDDVRCYAFDEPGCVSRMPLPISISHKLLVIWFRYMDTTPLRYLHAFQRAVLLQEGGSYPTM